jgi:selenocysteine-specific elongation factor
VIDPAAPRRRWRDTSLASLELHESGSLAARLVERLAAEAKPASAETLAQAVGAPLPEVADALERLAMAHEIAVTPERRYVAESSWNAAREAIERAVRAYIERHPARYGVMKGELKSGLKAALDAALFDAAFAALIHDEVLEQRGEHVRPADTPWQAPADMLAALESVERELEAAGYLVPENAQWQKRLGARAGEIMALGVFTARLVRVSQELTYTAKQMQRLRATLAEWFAKNAALSVGNFRELTGASRKYAVPLLEHTDRAGWTVRVGDERRSGERR